MKIHLPLARLRRLLGHELFALFLILSLAGPLALAQDDPPGRVGRLASLQGGVSWFDHEQGQWSDAQRNLPLTGGDRIGTSAQGRAEMRIGSTVLRLGQGSELEVLQLDDQRISLQLHRGSLALRVRSAELAGEIELVTSEARLLPLRAGHYRVDRIDDTTQAGSWRGDLRVDDPAGFVLVTGQRVELSREPRSRRLRVVWQQPLDDAFAAWVIREDQQDERTASARYVSPEMTGVEDLDRNGRWEQNPEFGPVWVPLQVQPDWAPYRYGRWAWVRPWGWTWVDDAPWGFAPFHYGRWAFWRNAWCWVPGAVVARPVFAPALVGWVGGGPSVGWVPLAPREVYQPQYAATPGYRQRVNPPPAYRWDPAPSRPPGGPVSYGNQAVPNAVTVVPRDVLVRRQPGAGAVVDERERRELRDGRDGRERDGRDAPRDRRDAAAPRSDPLPAVVPPQPPPGARFGPLRPPQPKGEPAPTAPAPAPREDRLQPPPAAANPPLQPRREFVSPVAEPRREPSSATEPRRERPSGPAPAEQPVPRPVPPAQPVPKPAPAAPPTAPSAQAAPKPVAVEQPAQKPAASAAQRERPVPKPVPVAPPPPAASPAPVAAPAPAPRPAAQPTKPPAPDQERPREHDERRRNPEAPVRDNPRDNPR